MKRYEVKVKGVTPLIMHNVQGANPMNKYTKEKKIYTAKASRKTDADIAKLAELDFKSSLYFDPEYGGLYMPVDNISKMLLEAARALDQKKAKKQIVGLQLDDQGYPLDIEYASSFDDLVKDESNKYFRMVTVGKAKTPSTRAMFNNWGFKCTYCVDDGIVDDDKVAEWWNYAGMRVGLGSRRPFAPTPGGYGKFLVESLKEV